MTPLQALLAELVRIPSPTPPGDCRAIAAFIAQNLSETGAHIEVLAPPDKLEAQSVVAKLGRDDPVIVLHAHIDTVPVAEGEHQRWDQDPYNPTLKGGKMYGKGSVDDKAPLAAMMEAFKDVAASDKCAGTLLLVAAAEEEVGGQLGTKWLADAGYLPEADFIVVGEQTHNHIALAHKGVMRAKVTTRGRSVHATNPDRGINAIMAMARVVSALENYHVNLRARQHPLVGNPTCNVGVIQGGSTANAVPDTCTVDIDRRMIPCEDPEDVKQELRNVIAGVELGAASVSIHDFLFSNWFDSGLDTRYGEVFQACVDEVFDVPQSPVGYLPGSDAKHLMVLKRGDMVVFGPGSYEVAHGSNEYVELDELETCERILRRFLQCVLVEATA